MSLKRYIQVLGALAAVLAFSALAAGAAQAAKAPRWTVNGVTPVATESFPFSGVSTGSAGGGRGKLETALLTLSNPAGKCTVSGSIVGSAVEQPGTNKEVVLNCKEVTVDGFEKVCKVNGALLGEVTTEKLSSKLVWLAATGTTHVGDTLVPPAGKKFTSIGLTGETCPFNGLTVNVEGTIIGTVETPNTDATTQVLNFPSPAVLKAWSNATTRVEESDGLSIFGEPAQFTNKFDLKLENDKLWGVEPG